MIARARVHIPFLPPRRFDRADERIADFFAELLDFRGRVLLFPSAGAALFFGLRNCRTIERVLVPAYNCQAVREAVVLAGKRIEYLDIDESTCRTLPPTPAAVGGLRGTALLATHHYGIPDDIAGLGSFCKENGVALIEDAAAGIGSRIGNRSCGTFGDFSVFSFGIFKTIPVPFGMGAMLTLNEALADAVERDPLYGAMRRPVSAYFKEFLRCKALRLLAHPPVYALFHRLYFRRREFSERLEEIPSEVPARYRYAVTGFNKDRFLHSAASARRDMERRREIARHFLRGMTGIRGLSIPFGVDETFNDIVPMRFPLFVKDHRSRRLFYTELLKHGIDTGRVFPFPLPGSEERCPRSLDLTRRVVTLPFHQWLSDGEVRHIVSAVQTVAAKLFA